MGWQALPFVRGSLLGLRCMCLTNSECIAWGFPWRSSLQTLSFACLQGPHSFTQLQWGKTSYFHGIQRKEKKNTPVRQGPRNGLLKFQVTSHLPPWEWRSGYNSTPVPLLSVQNFPGYLAALAQVFGEIRLQHCQDRRWHRMHAAVGEKSQEYKRTCSQLNNTAAGCQENPLCPVQAALWCREIRNVKCTTTSIQTVLWFLNTDKASPGSVWYLRAAHR